MLPTETLQGFRRCTTSSGGSSATRFLRSLVNRPATFCLSQRGIHRRATLHTNHVSHQIFPTISRSPLSLAAQCQHRCFTAPSSDDETNPTKAKSEEIAKDKAEVKHMKMDEDSEDSSPKPSEEEASDSSPKTGESETNDWGQTASQMKSEMQTANSALRAHKQKAAERRKLFGEELAQRRAENEFEVDATAATAFVEWMKARAMDWLYVRFINSNLTLFGVRFVSYEEFMSGVHDSFAFFCQCLAEEDYDSIRDAVDASVFDSISDLKKALFDKGSESVEKMRCYVCEVNVDRQSGPSMEHSSIVRPARVNMVFVVRFYLLLDTGKQKYVDCQYASSWRPKENDLVKFQLDSPWTIHRISVTQDDDSGGDSVVDSKDEE